MKPILFNGEMVRAILDGRKTVTRRVVKPISKKSCGFSICSRNDGKGNFVFEDVYDTDENERMFDSPQSRIRVGDVLYVRETFAVGRVDCGEDDKPFISQCVGDNSQIPKEWALRNNIGIDEVIWKPSIFMPKEAARIFLKVTGVRVERLQDIDGEGCRKEGTRATLDGAFDSYPSMCGELERCAFEVIWNSTIKKIDLDEFGWDANPWVWVIEFERCEKEVE